MHEVSISAEKIFTFGGLPVTNALLMTWLVMAFLGVFYFLVSRRLVSVPKSLQNILEILIEALLGLVESIFGDRAKAEKYFPFVATIFIFILTANWFGIFPFLGAIGVAGSHGEHAEAAALIPIFRSSASDINFTLTLAIIAMCAAQWFGIVAFGFFKHLKRYLNFSNPIHFFIGILELFSELSKTISLSFRLFGNVFAGEVLLLIVGFLAPYLAPVPFLFLEMFVGLIQALVFTVLTTIFIHITTSESHEQHTQHA